MTHIDRGQWPEAAAAAQAWAAQADAANDALEALRARAATAAVAVLSGRNDAGWKRQDLLAALDAAGEAADSAYPPTSTEVRLFVGLLAAYAGDRAGVADALRRTQDSRVVVDYPTVAQLQQVLLAEQERLDGKAPAAVARLASLADQHTALVATHWGLMRAEAEAGNAAAAQAQSGWLATQRGRVFAEGTTTDLLRFFNAAVSAEAMRDRRQAETATR